MSHQDAAKMTRPQLIAECRQLHIRRPGGLTRARKAELVRLVTERRAAIAEYAAEVKPYKVCQGVDRNEINQIRHEAYVSPTNINEWRDRCIAEIEAAPLERLLREYATREEADADAAKRNLGASRDFYYYVAYIDATFAELGTRD
jgi:hypothetical protein